MSHTQFRRFSPNRLALTLGLAASLLVQPGVAAEVTWTSGGPQGGTVTALAIDPQTPTTLYASLEDRGVFKTTDGGRRWRAMNSGLPYRWIRTLAIDPRTPAIVYAASDVFKDKNDVFKSIDGGHTWRTVSTGLPSPFSITALAIDPQTPTTIYVGGRSGLLRSSNGAETWKSTALNAAPINAIAIDPKTPTTVYAGGARDLFKTIDGGSTWRSMNAGFPSGADLTTIAIDPKTPATIYVAVQVLDTAYVFKSDNGGETWRATFESSHAMRISTVAIDSQRPSTLYAGTLPGYGVFAWTYTKEGVFKSTDGGATWRVVDTNLGNGSVTALVVDPRTPTTRRHLQDHERRREMARGQRGPVRPRYRALDLRSADAGGYLR